MCQIDAVTLAALKNACSIGVDCLVQMDALEPAEKLFPAGMIGQYNVCPQIGRGLTRPGTKSGSFQSRFVG